MNEGFFTKKETESVSRPDGRPRTCISCGIYRTSKNPKMKPFGNFKKGIMNIGACPEEVDDSCGKPFHGRDGKTIKTAYHRMGIDLFEDCINLNAVNCFCSTQEGERREPTPNEVETCRKSILAYIKQYKPRIIVLFGESALLSVIGHRWKEGAESMEKWRGFCIPDQEYKAWLIPVFDPNFLNPKKPEIETIWIQDLSQVKEKLNEEFPNHVDPVIDIVDDFSMFDDIVHGTIAFDYETTGLKPHAEGHRIICVSVADSEDHVWVGRMPESRSGKQPFKRLLQSNAILKMAHNMKFEDTWTNVALKFPINHWWWDSMQAAHVLDNREGITGLKFQTYVNFGVSDYSTEVSPYLKAKDDKNANSINRIEELLKLPGGEHKLLTYCGLDSIYEFRLAMKQQSIMNYLPF